MPAHKTTIEVETPAGTPKTKSPRITVDTGGAKTARKSASHSPSTSATKEKKDPPQPLTKEPQENPPPTPPWFTKIPTGKIMIIGAGAAGLIIAAAILIFAWKGLIGASSDAVSSRFEKTTTIAIEKSDKVTTERIDGLKTDLKSDISKLNGKIEEIAKEKDAVKSEFAKKTDEIEKGMERLAEGIKEARTKASQELSALRTDISKEGEVLRKQTTEKIDSIVTRVEERLKGIETKAVATKDPTEGSSGNSSYSTNASDTRMVVAPGRSDPTRFDAWELRPGDMSVRFCRDDIQAGKVEISKKPGIIARNHLSAWRNTWIDVPVPPDGNYKPSPQATHVSFYSQTETFTVKKLRM
jgi:hypothetical protein